MEKPILAAIIFTYNHRNHIARCIESLVNQNTTYNYQIRIYDDCSTDGTTDICREYAAKYPEKIKLTVQPENTFLKPYNEMQSYKAIQDIDTKYFCIIDGDDCWCDENKLQIALDFLENNPEYIGFAHDTNHICTFTGEEMSYVHEIGKWNDIKNPMPLAATPYYFTSSRIFRNLGFKEKHLIPVDYLIYFFHAQKGPIYFYDKIMANYYVSEYNNFSNMEDAEQKFLLSSFGYKIAKFFDYKEDALAMDVQAYYNKESCKTIEKYKKIFGVKAGWNIYFLVTFVPKFGFEAFDLNWVCPRKLIKKRADTRLEQETKRMQVTKTVIRNHMKQLNKQIRLVKIIDFLQSHNLIGKEGSWLYDYIEKSRERKVKRIAEKQDYIKKLHQLVLPSKKIIHRLKTDNKKENT
ncbi:MAG: glycosyltransferase family 2 protein [Candidatus Gastranaerophilales bacterium]|nr:glycosyltransferase family 2 protein [Candidatus Gastranaerophilales bacterium]